MKRIILTAALLAGVAPAVHADTPQNIGIITLYLMPDQTIDVLAAVWTVVAAEGVDNLYALDINGFTFTSPDDDDQSDPFPLDSMTGSN